MRYFNILVSLNKLFDNSRVTGDLNRDDTYEAILVKKIYLRGQQKPWDIDI